MHGHNMSHLCVTRGAFMANPRGSPAPALKLSKGVGRSCSGRDPNSNGHTKRPVTRPCFIFTAATDPRNPARVRCLVPSQACPTSLPTTPFPRGWRQNKSLHHLQNPDVVQLGGYRLRRGAHPHPAEHADHLVEVETSITILPGGDRPVGDSSATQATVSKQGKCCKLCAYRNRRYQSPRNHRTDSSFEPVLGTR